MRRLRKDRNLGTCADLATPIWWKEEHGPRQVGKLEVALFHTLLSGNGSTRLAVPLDTIMTVECRGGEVRLNRRNEGFLRIGSLDAPGTLRELAHALGAQHASVSLMG